MKKVYIVEDDLIFYDFYSAYFQIALPEFELVGIARDGQEALRACADLLPDLILIDIQLPNISGLELLKIFKQKYPTIIGVCFTGLTDLETIKEAVVSGADGFIEKTCGLKELIKALPALFSGKKYFSPNVYRQLQLLNIFHVC